MLLLLLFYVQGWFGAAGKAELAVLGRNRPGSACLNAEACFQQLVQCQVSKILLWRSPGALYWPSTDVCDCTGKKAVNK